MSVLRQVEGGLVYEVCDHEGTTVAIDTPEIEGVRCTECGCAWWRDKWRRDVLMNPDPACLLPHTKVMSAP